MVITVVPVADIQSAAKLRVIGHGPHCCLGRQHPISSQASRQLSWTSLLSWSPISTQQPSITSTDLVIINFTPMGMVITVVLVADIQSAATLHVMDMVITVVLVANIQSAAKLRFNGHGHHCCPGRQAATLRVTGHGHHCCPGRRHPLSSQAARHWTWSSLLSWSPTSTQQPSFTSMDMVILRHLSTLCPATSSPATLPPTPSQTNRTSGACKSYQ